MVNQLADMATGSSAPARSGPAVVSSVLGNTAASVEAVVRLTVQTSEHDVAVASCPLYQQQPNQDAPTAPAVQSVSSASQGSLPVAPAPMDRVAAAVMVVLTIVVLMFAVCVAALEQADLKIALGAGLGVVITINIVVFRRQVTRGARKVVVAAAKVVAESSEGS